MREHEPLPYQAEMMGKIYHGASEEEHSAGERKAIWVEQPNGERYPLPVSGDHQPEDRTWGYGGTGPRYLAQDLLADHLGFVPPRTVAMEYRRLGPARWEQGKPWKTTSEEIDVFLADPEMQARLEEQRQDELLEREIAELERREQSESADTP
jgi:Family of unknown function (DUF6166)